MLDSTTVQLRPVTAAASVLSAYGAELPPSVREALDLVRRVRMGRPAAPDLDEVGALYLDKTPKEASKALTEAKVAAEIHAAASTVAAKRAVAEFRAAADEVTTSILTSPVVREAAEALARVAPTVDPSTPHTPLPGSLEDAVIGAASIRKYEAQLTDAATALDVTTGAYFEADRVALLWLDPSGVSDFHALSHALRGVRLGHKPIPVQVTHPGSSFGVTDNSWHGLRSARAAVVPGIRFALVESFDEYAERVAAVARGLAGPVVAPEGMAGGPGVLVL